jgi:hypothetical protein
MAAAGSREIEASQLSVYACKHGRGRPFPGRFAHWDSAPSINSIEISQKAPSSWGGEGHHGGLFRSGCPGVCGLPAGTAGSILSRTGRAQVLQEQFATDRVEVHDRIQRLAWNSDNKTLQRTHVIPGRIVAHPNETGKKAFAKLFTVNLVLQKIASIAIPQPPAGTNSG